jgi:Protein of unknown function (DUF3866)
MSRSRSWTSRASPRVLSLRRGRVTAIVERRDDLERLEVDGVACIAYPQLTGPVAVDDEVLVNVQARELGLGSGGFDVLYANLTRGLGLEPDPGAHVMKLPYTPLQFARLHGEEERGLAPSLDGLPVVACSLHSQVVPVCAALAGLQVAYLQVSGGALAMSLSDSVHVLRQRGLVAMTVGVDACFGGDLDAVNIYSALSLARASGVAVAVCSIGPGIVGTGTGFGHGGMAAGLVALVAVQLGGRPVLVLRVSSADERERHAGVSHHARTLLSVSDDRVASAWPEGAPFERPEPAVSVDVTGWREACADLPLEHMGRGPDDDPWFFASGFAAGRLARELAG